MNAIGSLINMLIFFGILIGLANFVSKGKTGKKNESSGKSNPADMDKRYPQSNDQHSRPQQTRSQNSSNGSFLGQLKKEFQDAYAEEQSKQGKTPKRNAGEQQRNTAPSTRKEQESANRRLEEQREKREPHNQRTRHSNQDSKEKPSKRERMQEQTAGSSRTSIESRRASNRLDRYGRSRHAEEPVLQNVVSLDKKKKKSKKKKTAVSFGNKQMVQAMIYKEVLDKPLSMRETKR